MLRTINIKLFKILNTSDKKKLSILVLILLFSLLLEAVGLSVLLGFITLLTSNQLSITEYFPPIYFNNLIDSKYILLSSLLILYVFKLLFLVYLTYRQNRFLSNLVKRISVKLYSINIDIEKLNNRKKIPDQLKLIFNETSMFHSFITAYLTLVVELVFVMLVIFILIIIEPTASILSGLIFLFFSIVYHKITKNKIKELGIRRENLDKDLFRLANESLNGIYELYLFKAVKYFRGEFEKKSNLKYNVFSSINTLNQIPRYYYETVSLVGISIFIIILLLNNENISSIIATVGVFVAGALRIIPSLNRITASIQQLKIYYPSFELITNNLSINETDKSLVNLSPNQFKGDFLKIQDLKFSYKKKSIFNNLNLKIDKGDKIGIYGDSGEGKSTLVKLLLGILKPDSGRIFNEGIDIHSDLNSWINKISCFNQSNFIFNESLQFNITFNSDKKINNKKYSNILKITQLDKLSPDIRHNKIDEKGASVSGGQSQRISIARALYKDFEFLILDEPTSSLDRETKDKVLKEIFKKYKSKTILIISHDMNSLSFCNKKYLLEKGSFILTENR